MTLRDLVLISGGNLWRMKLRTFLTVSGVVIAIAAFVSMLSFAAGMQENISEQFDRLGLLSTMYVYPLDDDNSADTVAASILDQAAVERFAALPGVRLAYPYDALEVTAAIADTEITVEAQALPAAATRTKLFSQLEAGAPFASDSAREALVSEQLLERIGIEVADSIIGRQVVLSVQLASLDSGLFNVLRSVGDVAAERFKGDWMDSISSQEYWRHAISDEAQNALRRFLDGYMNHRRTVSETLSVCGVLRVRKGEGPRPRPLIIPANTMQRFNSGGLGSNPMELFSSLQSGSFFASEANATQRTYPRVTLSLDPYVPIEPLCDTLEAMGYRTFSWAQEFDEIRRFFMYFNLALGVVGLIALTTASLGIVNTMVMSIVERTREIGVLKSLGADDRDIRLQFLVESGVIGSAGAIIGIVFGWLITRVVSAVAQTIMEQEGFTPIDLFSLPLWLIGTAYLFGLIVSLAAGYYPASRAARVDPVEALRND